MEWAEQAGGLECFISPGGGGGGQEIFVINPSANTDQSTKENELHVSLALSLSIAHALMKLRIASCRPLWVVWRDR